MNPLYFKDFFTHLNSILLKTEHLCQGQGIKCHDRDFPYLKVFVNFISNESRQFF